MTRLPPGASLPGYIVKPSGSLLLMVLATRSEALAVPQNVIGTCPMEIGQGGGRGRYPSVFPRPGLAKHPIDNVSDPVHSGGDRTRQTTDVSGRLGPTSSTAVVRCTDSGMAPRVLSALMAPPSRREKSRRSDPQVTHPDGYVGLPGGRSAQLWAR